MAGRLVVVAHYDPDGQVAPFVLRQLAGLRSVADTLLLVSTATLSSAAIASARRFAEVIERPNVGQDFGSWHHALDETRFARNFDELVLTNDSFVSTLPDWGDVFAAMSARGAKVWGITKSRRHSEHLQSYFLAFTRPALRSQAFTRFWTEFQPAANRTETIRNHELGLSRAMLEGGFTLDAYFRPLNAEVALGEARRAHWLAERHRRFPEQYEPTDRLSSTNLGGRSPIEYMNWADMFADAALRPARLPVLKLDVLRHDPLWLGSEHLLDLAEHRLPAQLAGVREYLARVADRYPARSFEGDGTNTLTPWQQRSFGYGEHFLR